MLTYLKKFEHIIVISLLAMMVLTILVSTVVLGWQITKNMITPPLLLDINELLDIFGLFLLVLLGIELIYTLKTYLTENEVHVEVILLVALIAIGRKVIILDVKELSGLTLVGIATIIIALSVGYYFIKQHLNQKGPEKRHQ